MNIRFKLSICLCFCLSIMKAEPLICDDQSNDVIVWQEENKWDHKTGQKSLRQPLIWATISDESIEFKNDDSESVSATIRIIDKNGIILSETKVYIPSEDTFTLNLQYFWEDATEIYFITDDYTLHGKIMKLSN